jgi:hypothetical protein
LRLDGRKLEVGILCNSSGGDVMPGTGLRGVIGLSSVFTLKKLEQFVFTASLSSFPTALPLRKLVGLSIQLSIE